MSLSHLNMTFGIPKSVVNQYIEMDRMMVELQVLRPDLKTDLVKAECVKIAATSHSTSYFSTLKSCVYKAKAGKPMPWESQD